MRTMRREVDSDIFLQIQLVGGLELGHSRVSSLMLLHIECIEKSRSLLPSDWKIPQDHTSRSLRTEGFLRFSATSVFEHPQYQPRASLSASSTSHITLLPSCLTIGRCPLCRLDKIFHHKTAVGARSVSSFVWSNIRSQSSNQYKVNGSGNAG
jgi:hypothetical protein